MKGCLASPGAGTRSLLLTLGLACTHLAASAGEPSAIAPAPADTAAGHSAPQATTGHPLRVATASRCTVAPVLDGRLDDPVWSLAAINTDFTQHEPEAGKPMTERTEFRVLFDDEALYVGAMLYDRSPAGIMGRLARRDAWKTRDEFSVNLDPQHDHQTGNFFVVDPSGWMGDGVLWNDGWDDDSWDGVWEARTAVLADGWSVEMKIPYHTLRFSPRDSYTWGLQVMRTIGRRAEHGQWVYNPPGTQGWNSRFGHLEGIHDINPPGGLEALPFATSRLTTGDSDDGKVAAAAGLDMRYAVNSGTSLNLTVNPDFGQVEADPAVLNLGVFETFLQERRPFFLEGNSLFATPGPNIVGISGPAQLFHSRRIGRWPGRFDLPDAAIGDSRPDNTTILGALKLSGKTAHHTSFGVLEAVTDAERARYRLPVLRADGTVDTVGRSLRVEPYTSYFVGRLQQEWHGRHLIGSQLTAVNGQGFDPAYVGAVDAQLKGPDNRYRFFSRLAFSQAGQGGDRDEGLEADIHASRFAGWLGGEVYADVRTEGFQANDLGYMDRAGRVTAGAHVQLRRLRPWRFGREGDANLNVWHHRNLDGLELARGVNLNLWNSYANDWGTSVGLSHEAQVEDDLVTRGGPAMVRPASTRWWVDTWTDERTSVSGWVSWGGRRGLGGANHQQRVNGSVEWRPRSNAELELEAGYNWERADAQWVTNVDDDGDGTDDHFVFADLHNHTVDVQGRASIAFTPRLSLQALVQPFVAVGDYGAPRELARPGSFAFSPYGALDDNPDFNQRSLRANVVARWEYAPGSTVFAVWQQISNWEEEDADAPRLRLWRALTRSMTDGGSSVFLLKINRWFGR